MPEIFNSAITSISSSAARQNNFLLATLALFWCTFPFSTCITENPWVAEQLLLITKVRWVPPRVSKQFVKEEELRLSRHLHPALPSPSASPTALGHPPLIYHLRPALGTPHIAPSSSHSRASTQGHPHSLDSYIPLSLPCQLCPSPHKSKPWQLLFT